MTRRTIARAVPAWLGALALSAAALAADQAVTGRVVHADGRPAANVDIATFWAFETGAPTGGLFTTDADGRFAGEVRYYNRPVALMALDAARESGGLAILDPETIDESATITLGPLVRLKGTIASPGLGRTPEWTNVYLMAKHDGEARGVRIAGCGSTEATFDLVLPAGEYEMWAYGRDLQDHRRDLTLSARKPEMDLGAVEVPASIIAMHYGKAPPKLKVSHARGAETDVQLSDYKGKWVLLEFWGFW